MPEGRGQCITSAVQSSMNKKSWNSKKFLLYPNDQLTQSSKSILFSHSPKNFWCYQQNLIYIIYFWPRKAKKKCCAGIALLNMIVIFLIPPPFLSSLLYLLYHYDHYVVVLVCMYVCPSVCLSVLTITVRLIIYITGHCNINSSLSSSFNRKNL